MHYSYTDQKVLLEEVKNGGQGAWETGCTPPPPPHRSNQLITLTVLSPSWRAVWTSKEKKCSHNLSSTMSCLWALLVSGGVIFSLIFNAVRSFIKMWLVHRNCTYHFLQCVIYKIRKNLCYLCIYIMLWCTSGMYCVKGTLSRDILLQVSFMNHLPPRPRKYIRVISIFFKNSRRYSQVKEHHRYQRHRCHRYQRHQWKIMGTISDCWKLKANLKKKMYLYVDSTT